MELKEEDTLYPPADNITAR